MCFIFRLPVPAYNVSIFATLTGGELQTLHNVLFVLHIAAKKVERKSARIEFTSITQPTCTGELFTRRDTVQLDPSQ